MKHRVVVCSIGVAVITTVLAATPAFALPVLQLVPDTLNVTAGDSTEVQLLIAGLPPGGPPSLGSFNLSISFDPAILAPSGVTFGPFLGAIGSEALTDVQFLSNLVQLSEVSLLPPASLDALQPGTFVLATLSFMALVSGTTQLAIGDVLLTDAFGDPMPTFPTIPEPGTLGLLGVGAAAAIYRRRRRHRRPAL